MGSTPLETHRQWQKCMKANNLPQGLEALRGLPQSTLLWFLRCAWFFVPPNTKDALSSVQKTLLLPFSVCREGGGRRLPR